MRAQTPWNRERHWPEYELLIAVIERARRDAEGRLLAVYDKSQRGAVQAEAKEFLQALAESVK